MSNLNDESDPKKLYSFKIIELEDSDDEAKADQGNPTRHEIQEILLLGLLSVLNHVPTGESAP